MIIPPEMKPHPYVKDVEAKRQIELKKLAEQHHSPKIREQLIEEIQKTHDILLSEAIEKVRKSRNTKLF